MIVWGPNALFDEANVADTGATTQGFCVALDATGTCKLTETILFADGSTIGLQGIQAAGSGESTRTMVGSSGGIWEPPGPSSSSQQTTSRSGKRHSISRCSSCVADHHTDC